MNNTISNTNLEIVSVHIPKTAGATFGHRILPQVYKKEQIFYDYSESLWIDESIHNSTSIKAIHGHFPAIKYKHTHPSSKTIAWLRNPLNLIISWFFFWKSNTDTFFDENHRYCIEKNLSFKRETKRRIEYI